jgi:hypothetical protein
MDQSVRWLGCRATLSPPLTRRDKGGDAGRGLLCVAEAVFSGEAKEGGGLIEGVTDVASG